MPTSVTPKSKGGKAAKGSKKSGASSSSSRSRSCSSKSSRAAAPPAKRRKGSTASTKTKNAKGKAATPASKTPKRQRVETVADDEVELVASRTVVEDGKVKVVRAPWQRAQDKANARMHSKQPRTKAQLAELKKAGDIKGYWTLPRGAPPKAKSNSPSGDSGAAGDPGATGDSGGNGKKKSSPPEKSSSNTETAAAEKAAKGESAPTKAKKAGTVRGPYRSWTKGKRAEAMQAAVQAVLVGEDPYVAADKVLKNVDIPRTTLLKYVALEKERLDKAAEEDVCYDEDLDLFDRNKPASDPGKKGRKLLTTQEFRDNLQRIICARDNLNNGVTRKEAIAYIADFHGVPAKKAGDHYDYLVRQKMLPDLKRGGRVISAQATTTNRTAITTEKLLRNHTAWVAGLEQVRALNRASDDPAEFAGKIEDSFAMNLDESNFMASEGQLKIIGNKEKAKHEKNTSDSRESVTTVRIGSAAGEEGPRVYLGSGKAIPHENLKAFQKNHKSPPGSHIQMTPSAYMTNEAWEELVHEMCRGIRAMPIVKDHPSWWVYLSLDGFGSHLSTEALEVFAKHKVLVFKEEGDTSQACQAYDQHVAKSDKQMVRELLDGYRHHLPGVVTQWELILCINTALNHADPKKWRASHIRVNTCPSKLLPFEEWVKKHAKTVKAADLFFRPRVGLFDAMPAVWKHLSPDQRRSVCSLFKEFEEEAEEDPAKGVWRLDNVKRVMDLGLVAYDDIPKLRGCYLAFKEDPSVVNDPPAVDDNAGEVETTQRQLALDADYTGFAFARSDLMEKYMDDKSKHPHTEIHGPIRERVPKSSPLWLYGPAVGSPRWNPNRDRQLAGQAFCHMTNFVAMNHGWHTGGDLAPSFHLNVEMSKDQKDLLNPTPRDVQMAAIIDQCSGKKASKKVAKRRVDFINGNVNSYARVLNGPQQLERIKTFNDLASSISALAKEKSEAKEKAQEEKKKEAAERAVRKAEKERKAKQEKERLVPICREHVEKGLDHVLTLKVPEKRQILQYHFGETGVSKLDKADCNTKLTELVGMGGEEANNQSEANDDEQNVEMNNAQSDDVAAIPLPELSVPQLNENSESGPGNELDGHLV